jgi:hypothetical protein
MDIRLHNARKATLKRIVQRITRFLLGTKNAELLAADMISSS